MKTRAVRDGDDWVLNGSKIFITGGIICDMVILAALTDPNAKSKAHRMGLFIVDSETKGFKRGRNLRKLGLKGQVSIIISNFCNNLLSRTTPQPLFCYLNNKMFRCLLKNLKRSIVLFIPQSLLKS